MTEPAGHTPTQTGGSVRTSEVETNLPEPTASWMRCTFCSPRQACPLHYEEAARYWDLVRRGALPSRRLDHAGVDVAHYECASHEIEAAPGYPIFISGRLDGRRQTLAVDPDEVDELAKRLHQAKWHARAGGR